MDTSNSIFKFVTIRNATSDVKSSPNLEIRPQTPTVNTLVNILAGDSTKSEKLKAFNKILDDFIKSKNFYKTKSEPVEILNKFLNPAPNEKVSATEIRNFYQNLYNNIVVRTITKSNTTEVFKILTDTIKSIHQKLNPKMVTVEDIPKLKIILPEGLVFSFSPPISEIATVADTSKKNLELLNKINDLLTKKEQTAVLKEENAKQIHVAQQKDLAAARIAERDAPAGQKQRVASPDAATPPKEISTVKFDELSARESTLNKSETDINLQLAVLNKEAFQLLPYTKYVYVGERYVDITRFEAKPPIIEDDAVLVFANGCYLKFPFQVADLRVVEQKTVGYLPNEIAHINNTQRGEKQEKVTRRLKRIETFDSLITEDEVSKETDTQSTEKFSFEKAASDVQSEENSINVNASVSGTYGVVTASLDAGFSHTESSTNSNSSSQSYAKEVVQKVVDRVTHKVKSERSIKSLEEFEETVTHIIDNIGEGPKSYVYRWLTRLVRATLKNYGKRLIFQLDMAHPSNYYLSRIIRESSPVTIPPDPRLLKRDSTDPVIKAFYLANPTFPYSFEVDSISEHNYLAWADLYHAKLEQPPNKKVLIGIAKPEDQVVTIPAGYKAKWATINVDLKERDNEGDGQVSLLIGKTFHEIWIFGNETIIHKTLNSTFLLDEEINNLPVSILHTRGFLKIAIEIECLLEDEALKAWKIKCYQAIVEAYDNLKAEAESKMSEFNPNNPGLNPTRKTELIRTELKKGALLKMFRCNPFWINDKYEVGAEYEPDCCKDNLNAEKVRFLETTFDWKNMTYELHPYFYATHDRKNSAVDDWGKLLDLTDDDPHFESFLQSSYATVRIPVFRDCQKELAAINFILNNSIANHSVIPGNMQHILDDLDANTPFGYIDGTPTTIPFIEIKKEYDKAGNPKIYFVDGKGNEVICTEVIEFDKEGNKTKFYYDSVTNNVVISEIKEGINSNGQKYNYYFNSANEKIITFKTKNEFDIAGNSTPYYSTDLGIFPIPTDLVILEAGVQDGVEVRGYPEDASDPMSEVIIPKQYSPAIIKK
jgi:hypothetical protein